MCVHIHNPFLTVPLPPPHVVSFTVPNKTAPAGSNPFEDDDDNEEEDEEEDEEPAAVQRAAVTHISVKKAEMKTLVNRSKRSAHPQPPRHLIFFLPPIWFQ